MIKEFFLGILSKFRSSEISKKEDLRAQDLDYKEAQKVRQKMTPLPLRKVKGNKDISAI